MADSTTTYFHYWKVRRNAFGMLNKINFQLLLESGFIHNQQRCARRAHYLEKLCAIFWNLASIARAHRKSEALQLLTIIKYNVEQQLYEDSRLNNSQFWTVCEQNINHNCKSKRGLICLKIQFTINHTIQKYQNYWKSDNLLLYNLYNC